MLVLALVPTAMTIVNVLVLQSPPAGLHFAAVSILIPARNEETGIAACVESALASSNPNLEVIVLDDHSTDATAAIVRQIAKRDGRLRLEQAPPLPLGWSGKQHACHVLSGLAAHPVLVFVDADVRLAPDAATRLAAALAEADLVSCVPRQIMSSIAELLLIPMINALLLGYLPIPLMRTDGRAALGAGCGQLIAVRADAYRRAGGHAAIRHSLPSRRSAAAATVSSIGLADRPRGGGRACQLPDVRRVARDDCRLSEERHRGNGDAICPAGLDGAPAGRPCASMACSDRRSSNRRWAHVGSLGARLPRAACGPPASIVAMSRVAARHPSPSGGRAAPRHAAVVRAVASGCRPAVDMAWPHLSGTELRRRHLARLSRQDATSDKSSLSGFPVDMEGSVAEPTRLAMRVADTGRLKK